MAPCCKQIKFSLLGVACNIPDDPAPKSLLGLALLSCQMFLGQVEFFLDFMPRTAPYLPML